VFKYHFSIFIIFFNRIPILHIHGGEATYGNYDEFIRHSITKMSMYHFTATEIYRKRVIQLGESPDRVYYLGALGAENCLKINEKNVGIGYRCQLLTTNHSYTDKKKRTGKVIASDITIGDGCWIGAGSIINPGVTIGDGCVIASGSVVTRDCISNGLYAGVPAKMIKRLE
jgi:acetyltransferase-like isoleucine patch superfamily enzyme